MEAAPDYEFRTTCVHPFVDRDKILRMAGAIAGARRYVLQPFRPAVMLQPDFFGDADPACPPREIEELRARAADAVQTCQIRTAV